MLAHLLTERITIQAKTETKGEFGYGVVTWSDLYTSVPSEKKYINGSEGMNRGVTAGYSIDFLIRHRANVTTSCRVIWNGEAFNIKAIEPIGRKDTLRLICQR